MSIGQADSNNFSAASVVQTSITPGPEAASTQSLGFDGLLIASATKAAEKEYRQTMEKVANKIEDLNIIAERLNPQHWKPERAPTHIKEHKAAYDFIMHEVKPQAVKFATLGSKVEMVGANNAMQLKEIYQAGKEAANKILDKLSTIESVTLSLIGGKKNLPPHPSFNPFGFMHGR